MVVLFNFSWKFQIVFHNGYIILCSHKQCMRVPISPHLYQYVLLFIILITAMLMLRNGTWVLSCISLMINDVDDPFMCIFTIGIYSWENYLFKRFAQFLNCVVFLLFSCKSSLYFEY